MAETLLIDAVPGEVRAAVMADGRATEIVVERAARQSRVGQIFLGRVQKIMPALGAAFVELGLERAGFLRLDGDAPVTEGQAVTVQVTKDAAGRKGVQLTRELAVAGRTVVLTPTQARLQVSRRIGDEAERARLSQAMAAIAGPGEGFILRTNAAGATPEELGADADFVRAIWDEVEMAGHGARAPAVLHAGVDAVPRLLCEFAGRVTERIVVEDPGALAAAKRFCANHAPSLAAIVVPHDGPGALFEEWGVEAEIEQALSARVRLPSGGEIVIETTEALTAIDVNSAGSNDSALQLNVEAAQEIARQLRLRALGGLVVIDFVSMSDEERWPRLLSALGTALAPDRMTPRLLGRTAAGLVEVTRRRGREPLARLLAGTEGAADGAEPARTPESLAFEALRAIRREARARPSGRVRVSAEPVLAAELEGPARPHLDALARALGRNVAVEPVAAWPRGRFEIVAE
jgi:ribonuclease G